ncbi:MAG: hypothetical protein H7244_01795 [Herminiimonas sp.]|nr:hypothetical protein [Herminiimonas sp.]
MKKFVSERYGPLQARFSATHIRFSNVVRNEQKRRAKQAVEAYNNVKAEFNKVVDMIWKPVSEKDSTGVPPSYSNGPAEPPPEAPPRYTSANGGMPRPHATHPPPATTPRYHPNGPGPVRNAARTSQSPGTPVFTPISMASPRSAEGWADVVQKLRAEKGWTNKEVHQFLKDFRECFGRDSGFAAVFDARYADALAGDVKSDMTNYKGLTKAMRESLNTASE